MSCINKKSMGYLALLKLSGIPDSKLASICLDYLNKYERLPYLDEINGANSIPYIETLLLVKDDSINMKTAINATGANTIEEVPIILNNTYRDVEVELVPLTNNAIISITKRPVSTPLLNAPIEHDENINSGMIFSNIINKLSKLYGITTIEIDNSMLGDFSEISGVQTAKAFIHNGNIYINTDLADKDAPIHEMMHILVGSIKNTKLYLEIVESMIDIPNFKNYQELYSGRTLSDIAEEAFVSEFSKLAVGDESSLLLFPENIKYELFYNAKRVLDTILMGESSVKIYENNEIFNSSLYLLLEMVNSPMCLLLYAGMKETAEIHRITANIKQELMENNELEEHCEM